MLFTCDTIGNSDFKANIFDVPIFGVELDCHIECWYATGTEAGDIDLFACSVSVGFVDHELTDGAWKAELLSIVDDEIKSRIMAWNIKQYEAEKIQGGY
jgi:hypothetical protein